MKSFEMQEAKEDTLPRLEADEVSIKNVIQRFGNSRRHLYSRWKVLLLVGLSGAVLGLADSYLTKPVYTAECTFVLEDGDKGGSSLGQYSSLASMVGIDVGGSSSLFDGDNISQLYNSRLMLEKTLLTPVVFNDKKELLIDRYIELNKLRTAWKDNPELKNMSFNNPPNAFSIKQDSIMNLVVDDITKNYLTVEKPDKKLSLLSVKVKSKDQLFSKAFDQTIVDNVNSFYIQTKTMNASKNVKLLQLQADSMHRVLNSSIGNAAAASDATPNPDPTQIQEIKAPSQKRLIDVQAASAIYTEVVRNLEVAKGALERETPLIQVIDQPVLPLPVERIGKFKAMISGFFIGIILASIWLITMKIYRGVMN